MCNNMEKLYDFCGGEGRKWNILWVQLVFTQTFKEVCMEYATQWLGWDDEIS